MRTSSLITSSIRKEHCYKLWPREYGRVSIAASPTCRSSYPIDRRHYTRRRKTVLPPHDLSLHH